MKRLLSYLKSYKWLIFVGPFFKLVEAVFELLNDEKKYRQMEQAEVPFGDGHASEKILKIVEKYLSQQ